MKCAIDGAVNTSFWTLLSNQKSRFTPFSETREILVINFSCDAKGIRTL